MNANLLVHWGSMARRQDDRLLPHILLGWTGEPVPMPAGITSEVIEPAGYSQAVTYGGDSHLLSCGTTGSGKGRGVLIPTLLTCFNQSLAIDIKGELFQVTARRRREMGHQVIAIDPFHLVTKRSDSLNPLDLLLLPRADADSDSEMLASLLAVGHASATEPFWDTTAKGLIAGLIAHIATYPPGQRHLGHLREWIFHRQMDQAIATLLDNHMVTSRMARELLSAYLAAPEDRTRPCIRTTAATFLNALGSEQVVQTIRSSSFPLQDFYDGKPLSIYIIIPPDKLESHKSLLRLWVGTLLTAVMRRRVMPQERTLFLLDECAQLGTLPMLRQALTLLRGNGLQTWTFFQDLSQLRQCYPGDWQTILNNSGVLQVFGITNHSMAREWSEILGVSQEQLASLKKDGQLRPLLVLRDGTLVAGERTLRAAKLAGLTHVDVKVLEGEPSPSEIKKLQLIENLMRENLSDAEVYLACRELMVLNPGWLKKDLAAALHFDASMVTRILSVDELIPEAKDAFLAGKLGFSKCYAIAKGPKEEQQRKLTDILAGASRDEVERKARISRSKNSDGKKLSRIKIVLPTGEIVVVYGNELNMARLADVLMQAQKEVRKEASRHDIKSFASMQRVKRERSQRLG